MTKNKSDKIIRKKLRSRKLAEREQGLEELDAKYREPVCGYLSLSLQKLHFYRLLSEIPLIWDNATIVVWRKSGPNGDIREDGPLRPYLQTIAHKIALTEWKKLSRRHRHREDFVEIADLESTDTRRVDKAHNLYDLLETHYKAFTEPEIWIVEIKAELRLPLGELEPDTVEKRERRLTEMEMVTYLYNRCVDECNQVMVDSENQGCEKKKYIEVKEAKLIYTRALRRLRRIAQQKEKSHG